VLYFHKQHREIHLRTWPSNRAKSKASEVVEIFKITFTVTACGFSCCRSMIGRSLCWQFVDDKSSYEPGQSTLLGGFKWRKWWGIVWNLGWRSRNLNRLWMIRCCCVVDTSWTLESTQLEASILRTAILRVETALPKAGIQPEDRKDGNASVLARTHFKHFLPPNLVQPFHLPF
jgi:hypothetical protein